MIMGLQHIAMIVSSERSIDFYKCLGFEETYRKNRGYDLVVILEGNGFKLLLFIDPKHPKRATNPENLGLRNFSLKVDNLEKTMEELKQKAKDAEINMEFGTVCKDWLEERFVFIKDPDGFPIGLHE